MPGERSETSLGASFAAGCTNCETLVWFSSNERRNLWLRTHPVVCPHWPLWGRVWMLIVGRRRWW